MGDSVGYRFRPSDEEIITYYLAGKLRGLDFRHVINEVNMNELEPWALPGHSEIPDDSVWYFFTRPGYIDATRKRINRRTQDGFWKITGRDRPVRDGSGREIGLKKTLVFHRGRFPNGVRTCWTMQEYHYKDATQFNQRPFVLCRIKKKSDPRNEPNPHSASNFEDLSAVNTVSLENHELSSICDDFGLDDVSFALVQSLIQTVERPSSSNESDYELEQALVQSLNQTEERPSSSNESNYELEQDFVNSLWASDEDEYLHEETVQARRLHDFKPEAALSGYVADSSDYRVQTTHIQEQGGQILETPILLRGGSRGMIRELQSSGAVLQMGEVGLHKNEETSLSRDKILKVPQISHKANNLLRSEGSNGLLRGRSRGMIRELQSSGAVSQMGEVGLHKKEETSLSRDKILKAPQASSMLRSEGSNGSSRKSCFIFWETPPSSHKQEPPSVYIVNIVVALILLVFFVREMVSLH